jgi:uncharacterized protein YodC (DUF2158 family)
MSFSIGDKVRMKQGRSQGTVVGVCESWVWVQPRSGAAPFVFNECHLELDVLKVGDPVRVRKGELPIYFSATGTLVHIHNGWALIDGEGFRHPELRPLEIMELDR